MQRPLVLDRQALANGVFLARDLVFEPANKLYPEAFASVVWRWRPPA